jgi:GNAT superfamily N-acetyltransferase
MNLTIRELRLEDFPSLQANIFVRDTAEEVRERTIANLERVSRNEIIVFVAELDGEVVGNAQLTKSSHPLYAHRAAIDDVVVCYRYWRRGIARRLLEACRERARTEGVTIIEIKVRGGEPAEEVYRKCGFTEYGRLPGGMLESWSGAAYDEVSLWVRL